VTGYQQKQDAGIHLLAYTVGITLIQLI